MAGLQSSEQSKTASFEPSERDRSDEQELLPVFIFMITTLLKLQKTSNRPSEENWK